MSEKDKEIIAALHDMLFDFLCKKRDLEKALKKIDKNIDAISALIDEKEKAS